MEETAELGEVTAHADRPGYEPISSTLWRQREDYCARLIQGAWRRRGQPIQDELFGSRLGSRSVLDAVAEEASEEDEEDDDNARKASAVAGIVTQFLSIVARNFWCNMMFLLMLKFSTFFAVVVVHSFFYAGACFTFLESNILL